MADKHKKRSTTGRFAKKSPGPDASDPGSIGSSDRKGSGLKRFRVKAVTGNIYINNSPAAPGQTLPGASVVTLGESTQGSSRRFFTFDVSHPEVVI